MKFWIDENIPFARADRPDELASKLVKVVKLHEEVLTESFIILSLYNVEVKRLK